MTPARALQRETVRAALCCAILARGRQPAVLDHFRVLPMKSALRFDAAVDHGHSLSLRLIARSRESTSAGP